MPRVETGLDRWVAEGFAAIRGKRVGVIANPTSVDRRIRHVTDHLLEAPGVTLAALFGPEHGLFGDEYAGEQVADRTDAKTGLPIYSLYGKTRKPTTQMVQNLDAFVLDLQDIGCRSYTYVGTMKAVGIKFGRWIDVVTMQRALGKGDLNIPD